MQTKKIILSVLFTSLAFSITAQAEANLPPPVEDMVKLEKMAGSAGPFTVKDNFPKDYFLIPKNLPYLVGLSLYDPSSSKLNLTQKQIDALVEIKKTVTSKVAKDALVIKKLELEIVEKMTLKHKNAKAKDFYKAIDKIAKLKAALTKAHLDCIEKVQSILTKEQYYELLDYGVVNMF
jgi:hypothetical protein